MVALLTPDTVYRAACRLPRVVGGTGAEGRLVADHPRVATDLLRALGMPQQVRIVTLFPDQHEMRSRHEVGDERAARRRTGKRVGAHAVPAAVVAAVVLAPELLVLGERLAGEDCSAQIELGIHAARIRIASRGTPPSPGAGAGSSADRVRPIERNGPGQRTVTREGRKVAVRASP